MKIRTTFRTHKGVPVDFACDSHCETCSADQNAICDAHVAEAYRRIDEREKTVKMGICCTCQTAARVKPNLAAVKSEDGLGHTESEEEHWVMDAHSPFGPSCEGEGTIPQAIFENRG